MLGVIYVLIVNSKSCLMTIYKSVGKTEYYIYQMNETYVKVVLITVFDFHYLSIS